MTDGDFRLAADHLKLLRHAYVGWDGTEYGAAAIDCKRPYGNSDVEADVCRLLGWGKEGAPPSLYDEPDWSQAQRARAAALHHETLRALQVLLVHAGEPLRPGLYRRAREYDFLSWERVGD